MVDLRLLGAFEATLAGEPATSLPAQPKRAALVAYLLLASPAGFVRRDCLLALFWPDADDAHARRALNQALHHLRGILGADVIVTRGDDEVALDRTCITCDVLRVRELLAANRLEEALALYRGPLLPAFHAHASNEFDDWLDRERLALDNEMRAVARTLSSRARDEGNFAAALHWARRAVELDPLDETSAQQLIRVLVRDGNAAAARIEYDRFADRLRRELDVEPSPATAQLLEQSFAPPPSPVTEISAAPPSARHARRRQRWVLVSILIAIAASIALVANRRSPLSLAGARPTILIADVAGPASDSTLGDMVTQLLLCGLEDSHAARAVWSGEVRAALARMQLPPKTAVRGSVARDLAVREGYGAVIEGSVRDEHGSLLVTVSLVEPSSGHVLFTDARSASAAGELTKTVDALLRSTRQRIGDSRDAIARARPLDSVTTPSLDALRAYTEAGRVGRLETARQRALLERAVAIDSTFAAAYRKLGMLAAWNGQPGRASDLLVTAMRHSAHASERERASIEAMLYSHGRYYDRDRALAAWEALLARDTSDGAALLNAAWLLSAERRFDAAERAHARAAAMSDSTAQPIIMSLARDRFLLGRNDDAWQTLDAGVRRNPYALILIFRARAHLVAGHLDSAEASLHRAAEASVPADANADAWIIAVLRASLERQRGHVARALAYDAEQERAAREARLAGAVFMARYSALLDTLTIGPRSSSHDSMLRELRRLANNLRNVDRPMPALAEAYAESGDPVAASLALREYERGIAPGEWRETEPLRHRAWGRIALANGRPLDAVREFREADAGICVTCVLPLLSLAYERAGQIDSAIAVGERYFAVIDPSAAEEDGFHRPALHRRLGALYAGRGDIAGARRHLQAFVSMWRDADPELQLQVTAARRQLAGLGARAVAAR